MSTAISHNDAIPLQIVHKNDIHSEEAAEESRLEAQPFSTGAHAEPANISPATKLKIASAALCFFNAGINDGCLGALIPYILRQYHISTSWMAIPYGVAFFGWLLAAGIGGYARIRLGGGGVIAVGALFQLLAQVLRFWVPPFGLFAVTFFLVALGQALQEPQANTFVSGLKSAHRWLGLIHGCYATGGLVGPLIAAAIASTYVGQWATFYYVPLGIGVINLALCSYAFRDDIVLYRRWRRETSDDISNPRHGVAALRELNATLRQRPVWLLSIFFFLYLGAAITAGGWIVEFLVVVRGGNIAKVGYISSAFYGGLAAGRFLLSEPTFRLGEKRMFLAYGVLSLALQIVFWRVPNIVVDAVTVSLIGFLLGPAFATGVSVGSKLLPVELQPSGLSFIFVMAQAGGALFPAITGVIAAQAGVATLQPLLVGLLASMVLAWMMVPDPRKKSV